MKRLILVIIGLISLGSCARQISSDIYASKQVGEVSTTYRGIIRGVRIVTVEHGENLEENSVGIVGGGVVGGIIGNSVGGGKFFANTVGAAVGALAGAFAEKKLKEQTALEYIVELDNGDLLNLVQGQDQVFSIGEPVYVLVSPAGRSRIISQ